MVEIRRLLVPYEAKVVEGAAEGNGVVTLSQHLFLYLSRLGSKVFGYSSWLGTSCSSQR